MVRFGVLGPTTWLIPKSVTTMRARKEFGKNSAKNSAKRPRGSPAQAKPFEFKPGRSGNPGGRPKKLVTGTIEQETAKLVAGDKEKRTSLQVMVQGVIRQTVKGDVRRLPRSRTA
jgi:hypothetical protein